MNDGFAKGCKIFIFRIRKGVNMKVYVIMTTGEDSCYINKIFKSKCDVNKYYEENCMAEDKHYDHEIEEHEVVESIENNNIKGFYISMGKNGNIRDIGKVADDDLCTEKGYLELKLDDDKIWMEGVFLGKDKETAIDAANAKRKEIIEKNEWCIRR